MKLRNVFWGVLLFGIIMNVAILMEHKYHKLDPVLLPEVQVSDGFWTPRIETNQKVSIRHAFKKCEEFGNLSNFEKAAGLLPGEHKGSHAYDSDVYKIIEGAAYTLQNQPDKELEAYVDNLIDKIAAAQQDDGYLSTSFILKDPENKWKNLRREHELYCAGHLFEAAVAYYQATGKRKILDVAIKLADHIDSILGPGKRYDVPGHQEIELALIKLYRSTGEKRYFHLAKFFLDERGYAHRTKRKPFFAKDAVRFETPPLNREDRIKRAMIRNGRMQDHKPVVEQYEAVGHAVRAGYMYSAMTDVAALTGDPCYVKALDRLWEDVVGKKLYITGGIGTAQYYDEGFGDPYKLPNEGAYCETCAAIANIFWNHRMNLLHGNAKYIDVLELTLYNGFLSGISLSGDQFFYRNLLASQGKYQRDDWFDPACCPSNVVRMFPQIGRFVYASGSDGIYVNLFVGSTAKLSVKGNSVRLTQSTRYPWDGKVKIFIEPEKVEKFTVNVRFPGWCRNLPVPSNLYRFADDPDNKRIKVKLTVNGKVIERPIIRKNYVQLNRRWQKRDVIELDLPMPIRRVYAHPNVEANRGRVALMRGPLVYCLEALDNKADVLNLALPISAELTAEHRKDLLGGVTILCGHGLADGKTPVEITAIPYYSLGNRTKGPMAVWLIEDTALCKPKKSAPSNRFNESNLTAYCSLRLLDTLLAKRD